MNVPDCAESKRGWTSVVFAMLLFLVAEVAYLYANRGLIQSQRNTETLIGQMQTDEAAAAGVAWTLAALNAGDEPAVACDGGARLSWRAEALRSLSDKTRRLDAVAFVAPSGVQCSLGPEGVVCECGSSAWPSGNEDGFRVRWDVVAPPSLLPIEHAQLRVSTQGCVARPGGRTDCSGEGHTVRLKYVPALAHLPAQPLVAGLGVVHEHSQGAAMQPSELWALAVQELGEPTAPSGPLTESPMLAQYIGVTGAQFRRWATSLACSENCEADLRKLLDRGVRTVWVQGNLTLSPGLGLGSSLRPVLIVVDGDVHITSDVAIAGAVLARSIEWDAKRTSGASLRGAMMVQETIVLRGAVDIDFDRDLLRVLQQTAGWFVRAAGA